MFPQRPDDSEIRHCFTFFTNLQTDPASHKNTYMALILNFIKFNNY